MFGILSSRLISPFAIQVFCSSVSTTTDCFLPLVKLQIHSHSPQAIFAPSSQVNLHFRSFSIANISLLEIHSKILVLWFSSLCPSIFSWINLFRNSPQVFFDIHRRMIIIIREGYFLALHKTMGGGHTCETHGIHDCKKCSFRGNSSARLAQNSFVNGQGTNPPGFCVHIRELYATLIHLETFFSLLFTFILRI